MMYDFGMDGVFDIGTRTLFFLSTVTGRIALLTCIITERGGQHY
jgi:hypothetical protein